jgi:tRNA threonylcarbamoyladenosine biosynthesis protein TsaB
LLEGARVQKSELELIAIALGPGSFTSLRVGVSLAKGLALGLKIPVVGVPSLPLLASRVRGWPGTVCALISDRANHAYVAWYEGDRLRGETAVLDVATLQAQLQSVKLPVLLMGLGAAQLCARLEGCEGVCLPATALCQPSGLEVAQAGQKKFAEQGADDLATLEPQYSAAPAID